MIYIITPVFNRMDLTKNYLIALRNQTNKNFKIIIVDDGSTDGTVDLIESCFPEVILLKKKGNLWWAEATNIGVKHALKEGASYIMTLNDDTIPFKDYIEKMYYWIEKEKNALLGAFAVDVHTNKAVFGGELLNWRSGKYENVLNGIALEERYGLKEVNVFPGRGLLIPTKVFQDIGFYDSKNFPQTVSDLDFTCRAYSAGYKIYCNYDAKIKIYTNESATISLRENKSLKKYFQHLFGIKGGGNLKWFIIFSLKNAPKKYLIFYMFRGILARVLGYPRDWIKDLVRK